MLPHVGDIDVMYHIDTLLAIPRGHPPPTQLPAEFHNYVKVHEIIDSDFPGYVYLEACYLLTRCSNGGDGKFNSIKYEDPVRRYYLSYAPRYGEDIHGPAILNSSGSLSQLSVDIVPCVRCLSWPPQAVYWPARHRNYGWPDSATLGRVVSNGCDVVRVAHRQCRQHYLMGKLQWLSLIHI